MSISLLAEPFKEIPLIVFALRAAQHPASIPLSLASLNLIQTTVNSFSHSILYFVDQFGSISEQLDSIRKLYNIRNIKNRIASGATPFPDDSRKLRDGISIEFRNVSFKYPGTDAYALRDVSFTIEQGQLCVIVGINGSGKSTVLKLIMRLYDPTEGDVLLNGVNIKEFNIEDLRSAISVLFQDYTHFPVTIGENIGMGDPAFAHDMDRIEQAAKLGGALEFIQKRPEGFNEYLERPVSDYYSTLPEGTKTLFGRPVDMSKLRNVGRFSKTTSSGLSGGQMQRIALSRTFMKSLGEGDRIGLLLFDEPSASLDPAAEHDLFERLRALRGSKTMVFSSHRYGNLTRHADVILCMCDSKVEEIGNHESLLKKGGTYSQIYSLQAQAFL